MRAVGYAMGRALAMGVAVLLLSACDGGLEAAFIQGRAEDPCLQNLPACPGLFATCSLNADRYARTTFPGAFNFMVNADANDQITVKIFFAQPRDAGLETQIFWNEPGCTDVYTYDSGGADLFDEAKATGYISESKKVLESGDHLIQILSDMQADVIIAVDVHVPGT